MTTHAMRTFTLALLAGAILASPSVARANDWFVSPFIGAHAGSDAPRTSPGVGVSGGWIGRWVGGEFDLGYDPEFFDQNGFITNRRMITMMGNAIAPIPWVYRGDMFKPYIVGGVGVLKPKLSEAGDIFALDARKFGMNLGGGVMSFVNPHVGVRGDVRYFRGLRGSDADTNAFGLDLSTFHYWRVSVGLIAKF